MAIPKDIAEKVRDSSILTAYRGSIAHGMYKPKSDPDSIDDKDVIIIVVPSIDHYFGLRGFGSRGTKTIVQGEWDVVVYELLKFIRLLAQGNPNVLATLWLDENYYIFTHSLGRRLIDNRDLFVGKHVFRSFAGYARSQHKKMTAPSKFQGHMGIRRRELVAKYGYDCKNAAHMIRLLRMGIEFLTDGKLYVMRHDAGELLSIKSGEWALARVQDEAERLFDHIEQAYMLSKLPANVDMDKINELAVRLLRDWFEQYK